MKSPKLTLQNTILAFTERFIEVHKQATHQYPQITFDDQWQSPCELSEQALADTPDEGYVFWKPVVNDDDLSFNNIEQALNIQLHEDIKNYFTSIYSETISVTTDDGDLFLLFPWNKDDFDRLQENMIGHILMKQRLKQPITLFFATTNEEDMILSCDNETGQIGVERVGCNQHKILANSMAEFIESLTPNTFIEM